MARLVSLLLLLLPTLAFAQQSGQWSELANSGGCIGGLTCQNKRLTVPLDENRAVIAVRFKAHDNIGTSRGGVLRVKIDANTINDFQPIKRELQTYTIEVDELTGRQLIFEGIKNDEVEIRDIAVLYSRDNAIRRVPRDRVDRGPVGGSGGWRSYPAMKGCIGGNTCRQNGTRLTIALEDRPVLGVRFWAHDNIGSKAGGEVRVRIDNATVSETMDVKRDGKRHEVEVDNVTGSRLVIETVSDDEVEVSEVEVLYGRRGGSGYGGRDLPRELTDEGACIGGDECGGRRARIRIPLRGIPVESIRFYARDDVGAKAGGELRIRIDDEILRDYLDIPRAGRTFDIDGKGIEGDYLYIEVTEDDEVVVKDIRIRFGRPNDDE